MTGNNMPLTDKLKDDLKSSLKAGNSARAGIIRLFLSEVQNQTKEKFGAGEGALTDDEAVAVLQKEAKKRRESIVLFRKGGREDLVKKEELELSVLGEYLPKAMTSEEIKAVISAVMAKGPNDFNSIMKEAMRELKGKADGKTVGDLIKGRLS